jgi:hypothetical protein
MSTAMTKQTMVIVTSFQIKHNAKNGFFSIGLIEKEPACPNCKGLLVYYDHRKRSVKDGEGIKTRYFLRRLRCANCKKLHIELPDIIQPRKHYSSDTIQEVLDGGGTCCADDSTIRRWRGGFAEASPDIEQRLRSLFAQETNTHAPISTGAKTLNGIRRSVPRWLAFVMELLINGGYKIFTRFAFCPRAEEDKVSFAGKDAEKGAGNHDKTEEDTG